MRIADAKQFGRVAVVMGGSSAERDDKLRLNQIKFGVKPGTTGGDFTSVGGFMNAPFSARLEFEMFDGIGDVTSHSVNSCRSQRAIKHLSRWTNERFASAVFRISGLFSDKNDF